ncbi:MAG: hypothetical protein KKB31_07925 [Nanoarchaeota archaeon]|nr:hypothetical protein [Nanoarchaeota archaeon]
MTGQPEILNVYLAGSYFRRDELRDRAAELEADGHHVTSSWLQGDYNTTAKVTDYTKQQLNSFAIADIWDIDGSDVFIVFSDAPTYAGGGKHFETGYAYKAGLPIIVIGDIEHAFHALHGVQQFDTWAATRQALIEWKSYLIHGD